MTGNRIVGVRRVKGQPRVPLPGFEAVQQPVPNDLGVGARAQQMRELYEACIQLIGAVRVMRDSDSPLCKGADRLERALVAIRVTS